MTRPHPTCLFWAVLLGPGCCQPQRMLGQQESPPSCMEPQTEVQCQGLPSPHSVLPAAVCESGPGSIPLLRGMDPKLQPLQAHHWPYLGRASLKLETSDPTASSPSGPQWQADISTAKPTGRGCRAPSCSWHDLFPAAWPQAFTDLPGPQFAHLYGAAHTVDSGVSGFRQGCPWRKHCWRAAVAGEAWAMARLCPHGSSGNTTNLAHPGGPTQLQHPV